MNLFRRQIKIVLKKVIPFPYSRRIKFYSSYIINNIVYKLLSLLGSKFYGIQARYLPSFFYGKVFLIDTDKIKHVTINDNLTRLGKGYFCLPGSWDISDTFKRKSIFDKINPEEPMAWHHITVQQLFLENKPAKDTLQYRLMAENLMNNRYNFSQYECTSITEIDEYFHRLVSSFYSMKEKGYLSQKELGKDTEDEIPLYITRTGSFSQVSGAQHRIRMAEILNIQQVPCYIRGAHTEFIIKLCNDYKLPPHKAINRFINNRLIEEV